MDPATRIAADIEEAADALSAAPGATMTVRHTPADAGECTGPYRVQVDEVGALIVWCKDASGATASSHSTSSHARSVLTAETYIIDKAAGSSLTIHLERREAGAIIVGVE